MQEFLPRLRTDGKPEQRTVATAFQLISSGRLTIGQTDGQIVKLSNAVIDNGTVADRRSHDLKVLIGENIDKRLHAIASNHGFLYTFHNSATSLPAGPILNQFNKAEPRARSLGSSREP